MGRFMSGFRVQRYDYRRSRRGGGLALGCGFVTVVALIAGCGILYATGTLSSVVFQFLGAERVGDTETLFAAESPEPLPAITQQSVPNIAVIDLGEYGRQTVDLNSTNYEVVLGSSDDGLPAAQATFTEAGLLALCRTQSTICDPVGDNGYRNLRFDLRPGGGVAYVDVRVGPLWQRVGLVLGIARSGAVDIIGIDVDGTTYNPDGLPVILPADLRTAVSSLVVEVEQAADDLLARAALDMGGQAYRVREVQVDDTTLVVLLR